MAYLAIRGSGAVNGVSRLHGDVSRHIFEPLFPNGQHAKSLSDTLPMVYICLPGTLKKLTISGQKPAVKTGWLGMNKTLGKDIRSVTDERLGKCAPMQTKRSSNLQVNIYPGNYLAQVIHLIISNSKTYI